MINLESFINKCTTIDINLCLKRDDMIAAALDFYMMDMSLKTN